MLLRIPKLNPVLDGEWLIRFLGCGGAKMVGNAARAWRTAWLLDRTGQMRYGRERALIEAADDPNAAPTPALLVDEGDKAQGGSLGKRGLAKHEHRRALQAQTGYVGSGLPDNDDVVTTRLDEVDAVEVTLVDAIGTPRPLSGSYGDWSSGRIRVPRWRFRDPSLATAKHLAAQAGLPMTI